MSKVIEMKERDLSKWVRALPGEVGQAPAFAWEVTDLRSGATSAVPQMQGENILRTVLVRRPFREPARL